MKRFTLRVNCGNGQVENIWSGNEMSEARRLEAIAIKHWGTDDVWICDNLQEILVGQAMTREDVLSGVKFNLNGSVYTAHVDDKGETYGGHITQYGFHQCNVESFGPYAMRWYTYIMGRQVRGLINYKSLEAYVEAK